MPLSLRRLNGALLFTSRHTADRAVRRLAVRVTSRPMQDLQAISGLLDQKWNPIGAYVGPPDEQFPPGG